MSGQRPADVGSTGPRGDDLPRRLLAAATAWTPAGRADWSRAMLAELDQVTGRRARWRFALSAARVALVPPRSGRLTAIAAAAGAAAAALIIHLLLPQAGPVAATAVPGLPALSAWFVFSRPGLDRQVSIAGRAAQAIAVACLAACPAAVMREIMLYPAAQAGPGTAPYLGPVWTVIFAAELAVYLLAVLWRPGLLGAGRHSGLPALAALLLVGWFSVLHHPHGGLVLAMAAGALLVAGTLAALPGLIRGSGIQPGLRSGAAEVMWGVLLTGPALLDAMLLVSTRSVIAAEAAVPYTITEAHQQGATSVLAWVASDDLGGAVVLFTMFSITIALIFAIVHVFCDVYSKPPGPLPAAAGRPDCDDAT
jgi:hypothetical protein